MVLIKLNLTLVKVSGKKEHFLNFKESKSLYEILDEINLCQDEIGMVIRNDRWAPLDCIIEENDVIQLFPHLEGG